MDKSQIESTINEIRKRSGAVTAFIIVLFVINVLTIPTITFAQETNETETIQDEISKMINELNAVHILIEIGLAFSIPFIYSKIQKQRKKNSVIKIWKSKKDILEHIPLNTPHNNSSSTLKQIIFEISKMENQVAESFNEVDYLAFAGRVQYFKELIESASPQNFILEELKKYLNELVLAK